MNKNQSIIQNALDLTHEIFSNLNKDKYIYCNYELIWSIYNLVHIYGSIPFIEGNFDKQKQKKPIKKYIYLILRYMFDIFLSFYSLISMLYIRIVIKRPLSVIWTGDFYDETLQGDFRLGNLYLELKDKKINYIDFIRDNHNGILSTLNNMLKRRKPVIYYDSITRIFLFSPNKNTNIYLKNENYLHRQILSRFIHKISTPAKINLFRKIFNFLKVDNFICWEFSDRQSNLIYAAKLNNIRTIGFMHGAGNKFYVAHEYMSEFSSDKKIGPDFMGVYSEWWKKYFELHSKLYTHVEVCGMLRKKNFLTTPKHMPSFKSVLWISEPLIDPEEVIGFIEYLHKNYSLVIKKRPLTKDIFYNKLIQKYPECKNIPTLDGDIFTAINQCSLVVGSHSTAVIDALQVNKPCLLVNTKKWGNYFNVDENIFIKNTNELEPKISKLANFNFEDLKLKYFGEDTDDGVQWVIKKMTKDA